MSAHPAELVLPGEPPAVRFINTIWADRGGVHDALTTVDDLRLFLTITGRPVTGVDHGHVAQARRLRDALRRLAAEATGDERLRAAAPLAETDALGVVNAVMAAAPRRDVLVRTAAGWEVRADPDPSPGAALAGLARDGAHLLATGGPPLRACHAPGCVLYFVADHPRREWCGVACGNRVRAARHYRRHRAAGP